MSCGPSLRKAARPTSAKCSSINSGKTKLDATTELQSFGLIVTAEPYFAVTQPSDVVVMENFVGQDTTGTIEEVDAKYELLQRGQYVLNVKPGDIRPRRAGSESSFGTLRSAQCRADCPLDRAPNNMPATLSKRLSQGLENAEGYLIGKAGKKPIGTVAREAVQMAEDARIITVKKIEEEQLARSAGGERSLKLAPRATVPPRCLKRIASSEKRSKRG